jgi:hypothetical protein
MFVVREHNASIPKARDAFANFFVSVILPKFILPLL